jgi:hypothetical protein
VTCKLCPICGCEFLVDGGEVSRRITCSHACRMVHERMLRPPPLRTGDRDEAAA